MIRFRLNFLHYIHYICPFHNFLRKLMFYNETKWNCTSFSDWLVDRRHCQQKWQDKASGIREKINTAIQDMPPNQEITDLLSGTCMLLAHYIIKQSLYMHDGSLNTTIAIIDVLLNRI